MTVNLSIKSVPDELAKQLRRRAAVRHRSLQDELMAVLEAAVAGDRRITIEELRKIVRDLGLRTPDEAREMIRAARDAR